MNSFVRTVSLALVTLTGMISAQAQNRVVIKSDRTNVRAKPALDGEVLTSLKKGEGVIVLGEIPASGDQESWTKVAMPASVTVWVQAGQIDAKAEVVKSNELTYRAGPGRNYSVLGELKKGDAVKVVRVFDGWAQIEPPKNAAAFVATRLLDDKAPASDVATPEKPINKAKPSATLETRPIPPAIASFRTAVDKPASPVPVSPAPAPVPTPSPVVTPSAPPIILPPPTPPVALQQPIPAARPFTPSIAVVQPTPIVSTPPPPKILRREPTPAKTDSTTRSSERPVPVGSPKMLSSSSSKGSKHFLLVNTPKRLVLEPVEPRFVVRQGNVENTISPQAPTNYELVDGFYREGTIDYLWMEPVKNLEPFSGKRVLVSGYEYLDSRWRTPVLKIEKIELMPNETPARPRAE